MSGGPQWGLSFDSGAGAGADERKCGDPARLRKRYIMGYEETCVLMSPENKQKSYNK